jgi:gliding motility-associated-like protein
VDSAQHEGIYVQKSQLDIPNVFSPNGDGVNDVFYFKHQSLESCRLTIMDRSGKVVYKRTIEDIYDWRGWDGNLRESDRRAPEGQYYFVVEALGYDAVQYKDPTIWETMKIFGGTGTNTGGTGGTGTGGTGTETGSETLYTGWLYLFRH